ncbi:MAG: DNA replication/repair protein RecF [Eubacteriales bacterium]|nr:DNA replication/repair protein RecF [Eubacteriales bacterium]
MIIQSIELNNFRNYESLDISLDKGVNIFYGNNAQGKTNILDAVYVGCTSKSHRLSKDREMIKFDCNESHIRLKLLKRDVPYKIDMHLKKNNSKGIAINGMPIRRSSELFGIANVVIFSPEDLNIIKDGPSERRRFIDLELCQLNKIYVHNIISYTKVVNQKNKLLKEYEYRKDAADLIDIYNLQLIQYGTEVINIRADFIDKLNEYIKKIHSEITGGTENINLIYSSNTNVSDFEENLKRYRQQEIRSGMSLVGPHRDDIDFIINNINVRHYGSQGQQRTAVLSLKLSEIKMVEEIIGERPLLLLDDVLSELDRKRQNQLLNSINGGQTLITCTGLDDFVDNRFHIDKVFKVSNGSVTGEN